MAVMSAAKIFTQFSMEFFMEPTNDVWSALYSLQSEYISVSKNADNPFYNSRYTNIDYINVTARPFLQRYGLVYSQTGAYKDGVQMLLTTIHHIYSNTQIVSEFMVPYDHATTENVLDKKTGVVYSRSVNVPQRVGAGITYIARYALAKALGVTSADEDDDGNSASGTTSQKDSSPEYVVKQSKDKPADQKITQQQKIDIYDTFKKYSWKAEAVRLYMRTELRVNQIEDLPSEKHEEFMKALADAKRKKLYEGQVK